MTTASMQIGRWALASADADVQLGAVRSMGEHGEDHVEPTAAEVGDTTWTLTRFHERFGNQWVAGRVVISSEALEFRPRDQFNPVPLALRVGLVTSIEPVATLFHKAMRVQLASGEVLTFRCRTAASLVEGLETAVGAVRSAAA